MMHLLSLGAINKLTGEYVYPKIANKKDEYICPECNKDLILCQGKIRVHHFRHKIDNVNPCHHYSNPTESQKHKDAKMLMKNLLETKIPISFIRNCCCCKKNDEYEIPEIGENSVITLEHRFEYNGGPKIADVAYIEHGEILCIFEICNTHKTSSENRPEPWFEIDAETLIKTTNGNSSSLLQIPCIRCEKCEKCVEKEKTKILDIIESNRKFISNKLKISTTLVQKKKWNSLLVLIQIINPSLIDFGRVLNIDNDYDIHIIHPITKQKIYYHLKRDYMVIISTCLIDDEFVVNIIKDWLSETPTKLEDVKNWALNHTYLKGLLFIISSPLNEITYKTKEQNKIDNIKDFILWLNSFDNKLYLNENTYYIKEENKRHNMRDFILWLNSFDNKLHSLTDLHKAFNWKLDNVINWLKSNGLFNRCLICNCIYSYSKGKPYCNNNYCFK
jgi:Competence protein CoiA-like family